MTQTAQGSLTMVGLNTATPQVFWNGKPVVGLTSIRTDWEDGEQRVKLKCSSIDPTLEAELIAGGITVKKERNRE